MAAAEKVSELPSSPVTGPLTEVTVGGRFWIVTERVDVSLPPSVSVTVSASVVIDHRLGIVVALLGVGAIAAVFTLVSGRADRRIVESLPEVLHSIARVGRAGPGLREAVRATADEASGPVAADLASAILKRQSEFLEKARTLEAERPEEPPIPPTIKGTSASRW